MCAFFSSSIRSFAKPRTQCANCYIVFLLLLLLIVDTDVDVDAADDAAVVCRRSVLFFILLYFYICKH